MRRGRTNVTLKCVADCYAQKPDERIIEIFDPVLQVGCLIRLKRTVNANLIIEPYRADKGVVLVGFDGKVTVAEEDERPI